MINKIKIRYELVFLISVFVISFFLRFYKLDQKPDELLWDEAAIGYNAFSILKTGRDEYGQILPVIFKSFGDYKPGFYIYLTVPFVFLFGLNPVSVRLASVLAGSLIPIFGYLLIKTINNKNGTKDKFYLPEIFSIVLCFNPWLLRFSRGAWEVNLLSLLLLMIIFMLLKYFISSNKKYLIISIVLFFLSLATYQSAKVLSPFIIFSTLFFFRNDWYKNNLTTIKRFSLIVAVVLFAFWIYTLSGNRSNRIKAMGIFSYPRSEEESQSILKEDKGNGFVYSIYHGKIIFLTRSVIERYFNHFSGKFLFITGDWSNLRNGIVFQGVFYYLDFIFLIFGLIYLFSKKRNELENLIIFFTIISPIPSALTRDSVSSNRAFPMSIGIAFIISCGLWYFILIIKKYPRYLKNLFFFGIIFGYSALFIRMVDLYFVHDTYYSAKESLYGYKEAVGYVINNQKNVNKIIFTNVYGQPYIYYLFYSKYSPSEYQKQAKLVENPYGDVGEVQKIDNIEFRKIYFPGDQEQKNTLFIGDEFDLPEVDIIGKEDKVIHLADIKYPNNKIAFRIVKTK